MKFTLDSNCIIALEERRPEALPIRMLVDRHSENGIDVALIAMMASERPRLAEAETSFSEFQSRIEDLGLGHLPHVLPLCYWGISFWDHCLWADDAEVLEEQIHAVLFPNRPFRGDGVAASERFESWRNAKCDVQAMWSHIHAARDVFVTNDANFHKATKLPQLLSLGAGRIIRPMDIPELLKQL